MTENVYNPSINDKTIILDTINNWAVTFNLDIICTEILSIFHQPNEYQINKSVSVEYKNEYSSYEEMAVYTTKKFNSSRRLDINKLIYIS